MIVTCYLIIPGFEIEQTYQKIVTVQQIADGYSVSSEHRFEHQQLDYPTARLLNDVDSRAILLLEERKAM